MAKEFKSRKGYRVFKVSIEEIFNWGGFAVCDSCNSTAFDNVFIPVLNSCYCRECFNRWNSNHELYPEDIVVQDRVISRYKQFFKEDAGQ